MNLPMIPKGTVVTFSADNVTREGTFEYFDKNGYAFIKCPSLNKSYWRKIGKFTVTGAAITSFEVVQPGQDGRTLVDTPLVPIKKFDVNKQFAFLSSLVRMVIRKQNNALVITGDGGLGKTHTVVTEFDLREDIREGMEYIVIKGYSTAKGLYKTLYENSDKIIIYDDCDEVLLNDTAKNILKGALEVSELDKKRIVSWITSLPDDSSLPAYFEFTGQIIFISNLPKSKVPQPILSRAVNIDITMSADDKILRMETVLPNMKKHVPMEKKLESLEILKKHKHQCRDLNFRTLLKLIDIRTSGEENWEELSEYMVLS